VRYSCLDICGGYCRRMSNVLLACSPMSLLAFG
jgi:hypothetical protein